VPLPARLPYPVGEKAEEILLRLREAGPVELGALFAASRSRSELAAALMAVLELYRSEKITMEDTERGVMVGLGAAEGG
jgi:chromatin segregation and condensation protein Rec8/ScpA/Scc1 (kleisin family)